MFKFFRQAENFSNYSLVQTTVFFKFQIFFLFSFEKIGVSCVRVKRFKNLNFLKNEGLFLKVKVFFFFVENTVFLGTQFCLKKKEIWQHWRYIFELNRSFLDVGLISFCAIFSWFICTSLRHALERVLLSFDRFNGEIP